MNELDFPIEFHIEKIDIPDEQLNQTATSLRELTTDHDDLTGAAVHVEEISAENTPHVFRTRIVIYKRPENIVATKDAKTVDVSLRQAVDAISRQIRQSRNRRKKTWQRPDLVKDLPIGEMTDIELYERFGEDQKPQILIDKTTKQIAADLMVKHKLSRKSAYSVAHALLRVARTRLEESNP